MTQKVRAIAIIPARLASTRLPRKVLREIAGRPMLAHVVDAARRSPELADVIVATDSDEVLAVCKQNGWRVEMTSASHRSGTDRVWEVAKRIPADVYVNVQGDEPLARPEHISALLAPMKDPRVLVSTLKTPIPCGPGADVNNPNAVKVVTDLEGRALYFTRATVPFDRDNTGSVARFKHLGFYAYRREALEKFCAWPESELERAERLEQLRFLDHGIEIYVAETPYDTVGVDTEEDLQRVEAMIRGR
jgi:3-deoxy-manno-octulosonate cytidylyltransferase (CMP-KDO synthetase)